MNSIRFTEKDAATVSRLSNESLGQLTRAMFRRFILGEEVDPASLGEAAGLAYDAICRKADISAKRAAAGRRSAEKRGNVVPGKVAEAVTPVVPVAPVVTIAEALPAEAAPVKRAAPAKRAVPAIDSAEVERRFQKFYDAYPRHVGRAAALKKFIQINPDEVLLETMLSAVAVQRKTPQWTKDGGQFIPHPATWLNQRRWEDEVFESSVISKGYRTPTRQVTAQQYEQRDYSGVQDELMRQQDAEMEAFLAEQQKEAEQHEQAQAG